jgi:hypothetical protein
MFEPEMDADHQGAIVDRERDWMIYRCEHGCVHVALNRLTVTLTDDEFDALQALIRRAGEHFRSTAGGQALSVRHH